MGEQEEPTLGLPEIDKVGQVYDMHTTWTISLDAFVPTAVSVAQPIASADASAEIIDSLEKRIASLQATVC